MSVKTLALLGPAAALHFATVGVPAVPACSPVAPAVKICDGRVDSRTRADYTENSDVAVNAYKGGGAYARPERAS